MMRTRRASQRMKTRTTKMQRMTRMKGMTMTNPTVRIRTMRTKTMTTTMRKMTRRRSSS